MLYVTTMPSRVSRKGSNAGSRSIFRVFCINDFVALLTDYFARMNGFDHPLLTESTELMLSLRLLNTGLANKEAIAAQ